MEQNNDWRKFVREEYLTENGTKPLDPSEELSFTEQAKQMIRERKIDNTKVYPKVEGLISMATFGSSFTPVLTTGNISCITGKAKAKKSFLATLMVMALGSKEALYGTIKSNMINGKEKVLYIDTEQSEYHVSLIRDRIKVANNE